MSVMKVRRGTSERPPGQNQDVFVVDKACEMGRGDEGVELERIIPYLANRLTFRLNQLLKQDLKPFGLSIVKWRVLAVLAANQKVTINEIAEYAMLEQPTASRLILRMEADNLIARERDPVDGRVSAISLTELGQQKHRQAQATVSAHTSRAVDGLTEAECEQFTDLLQRMTLNLNESIKTAR